MRNSIKISASLILTLFFSFPFIFAHAAGTDTAPSGAEAGPQAERFRMEAESERDRLEKKAKPPKIEVEEEKAPVPQGPAFVLKGIKLVGNTIVTTKELEPIYEPYLGKNIAFSDLDAIVKKINKVYEQKGYLTTQSFIPEQDIKDGIVQVKVAEGTMGNLSVEGNKWFSTGFFEKFFHIKKKEPLNVNKLQRDILRLNENPDTLVKTVISAGKDPGSSDITLNVKDNFPWHVGLAEDNLGTRLTGKFRSSFTLRGTNVTGNGDQLFSSTISSTSSFGQFIGYSIPLDTFGTKAGIDVTYFSMKLGKEYKANDITGVTQIYTPYLSKELSLSDDFESSAKIGMDIKSIKKRTAGTITSSDQLRIPFLEFNFTENDNFGQSNISPRFNFSTDHFLGASSRNHPTSSRQGSGGFFFKYEQPMSRTQRMPFSSYCILRSNFQLASHTLPSSEQFQLGGMNSIRGYPEGDYLADAGGQVNFDWVFPMYLIPSSWKIGNSQVPLRRQIQPVFFFDVGGGKNKKVLAGEKEDKFLMGIGGGLRVNFNNNFNLRLEWAEHIGDDPGGGSGPSTFYFTLQCEV